MVRCRHACTKSTSSNLAEQALRSTLSCILGDVADRKQEANKGFLTSCVWPPMTHHILNPRITDVAQVQRRYACDLCFTHTVNPPAAAALLTWLTSDTKHYRINQIWRLLYPHFQGPGSIMHPGSGSCTWQAGRLPCRQSTGLRWDENLWCLVLKQSKLNVSLMLVIIFNIKMMTSVFVAAPPVA